MKGLTLTQPWAQLVALGEKRFETRGWPTKYRGPLAIHAAKGLADPVRNEDGLREWCMADPFATALGRHGISVAEQLPRGALVAICDLVDVLAIPGELKAAVEERGRGLGIDGFEGPAEFERAFGDYSSGRYAFALANVRALTPPIRFRGSQGLFDVPDDVVSAPRLV